MITDIIAHRDYIGRVFDKHVLKSNQTTKDVISREYLYNNADVMLVPNAYEGEEDVKT